MDILLVSVPDACRMLSVGKTYFYALVSSGAVRIVKMGRASRVKVSDLQELVSRLAGEGSDGAN
jgi:excisionase family DNA binding protein